MLRARSHATGMLLGRRLCLGRWSCPEVLEVVVQHGICLLLVKRKATWPVQLLLHLARNVLTYYD